MPVSRERKRKKAKPEQQKPSTGPPIKVRTSIAGRLITIILGVATLIGVPAAVIAFWPRMTVTPSGLFDATNAYSETFTVANTGFLPFENVQVGIALCSIETVKNDFVVTGDPCADNNPRVMIGSPSWWTPELRRDEPFSIVLSDNLNIATDKFRSTHPNSFMGTQMMSPLKAANVIVSVHFAPWPLPWRKIFNYRFVAKEQPNKQIMWRAIPLSWKDIALPE
jgi:hypothetical protein